jgi:DNA segregation ATPase FtsK/SpoIIIE-like protein
MPDVRDLIERQRSFVSDLVALARRRAETEARIDPQSELEVDRARQAVLARQTKLTESYQAERSRLEQEWKTAATQAEARAKSANATAEKQYTTEAESLVTEAADQTAQLRSAYEHAQWEANSVYEGARVGPARQFEAFKTQMDDLAGRLSLVVGNGRQYVKSCGFKVDEPDLIQKTRPLVPQSSEPIPVVRALLAAAETNLKRLESLSSPPMFRGGRIVFLYLLLLIVLVVPIGFVTGYDPMPWIGGTVVATILFSVLLTLLVRSLAWSGIRETFGPLLRATQQGQDAVRQGMEEMTAHCERLRQEIKARHQADLARVEAKFGPELQAAEKVKRQRQSEFERRRQAETQSRLAAQAQERAAIEEKYGTAIRELEKQHRRDTEDAEAQLEMHLEQGRIKRQRAWDELASEWQQGLEAAERAAEQIASETAGLFPRFDNRSAWDSYLNAPSNKVDVDAVAPPAWPLGELTIELPKIEGGVPTSARLRKMELPPLVLPAMAIFPEQASLVFRTNSNAQPVALETMSAVMLRLLTALPPAKVRFTIFDPVGLGQSFAAFMHLADYNEQLVTNRIWTEMSQIEKRLADVTEHMENVIQKYLRNEYSSIEEYNAVAGEIAEPYRFIVVADFPTNFSESAAKRLLSIAQSGPRCGVYLLLSVDVRQPLPPGFDLADLERHALVFRWKDGRFLWPDATLAPFDLKLEPPPERELFTQLVHKAGELARDAHKVEVPFEFIAPKPEDYWKGSTAEDVEIAIGRCGATKRQMMNLGHGTSQHVLIAGKTGSGKSTLLHTMITNLALAYRPDELELYLIDFKKGVEFKTYATYHLPHARVVAIESEREFGLSVMARLDAELKVRGDRFRDLGVQDLPGYRKLKNQPPLPRILLIVDEFQEFFTEDDKISQDAGLLLDRLVRQGRAFGIHVLFGSQTLGGSYSLPRSTIGQMAVRIALQCSEADAHLILSEENAAARLLNRPGEAIYNDANGRMEGNNPFQVAYLGDDRRDRFLAEVSRLNREQTPDARWPMIVFEGNASATLDQNRKLEDLLTGRQVPGKVPQAWLGEAIAIKDPTTAAFRRQAGSHLLIVGQQETAAQGVLGATVLSLAASHPPGESGTRMFVIDGSPLDASFHGQLPRLVERLPHESTAVDRRTLAESLSQITAEIDRRMEAGETEAPSWYLFVYDMSRVRDLRKAEDDFSFSRASEDTPPSPDKLLSHILREGPAVGVHVIAWCDTLTNVQRTLDRASLREFEMRVLFQMSMSDSTALVDGPQATRLGPNRALFFHEEQGIQEKFRPYGWPEPEWLDEALGQLAKKISGGVV